MRALVIEDDAAVAAGIERCLSSDGFEVHLVHDGADGLERSRDERFDLIVLDILLPSMNGYRVCEAIRSDDNWTPILMLTAKSGDHDVAEGLDTGADDFLTKPFSMIVLQARVHALLRRPRGRVEWPTVGDLRLDPLRRLCLRGDVAVSLTARETEVLAVLLEHADEIVSKSDILRAVWGPAFAGDRNIVEVYVGHLRHKLDEPFGRHTIETVRGEGYCLHSDQS